MFSVENVLKGGMSERSSWVATGGGLGGGGIAGGGLGVTVRFPSKKRPASASAVRSSGSIYALHGNVLSSSGGWNQSVVLEPPPQRIESLYAQTLALETASRKLYPRRKSKPAMTRSKSTPMVLSKVSPPWISLDDCLSMCSLSGVCVGVYEEFCVLTHACMSLIR